MSDKNRQLSGRHLQWMFLSRLRKMLSCFSSLSVSLTKELPHKSGENHDNSRQNNQSASCHVLVVVIAVVVVVVIAAVVVVVVVGGVSIFVVVAPFVEI